MSNGTDVLMSWDDAYDDISGQRNEEVPYAKDRIGLEPWWYKTLLATTLSVW